MYLKAFVRYEKVVGPNNPMFQSLGENFRALDTAAENNASIGVREPVTEFQRETSHLGAKGTRSKSKHHNLFKKPGLR
jgi:hypothetical protein